MMSLSYPNGEVRWVGVDELNFVAWELAVRYETACRLAELHYTQICDGPTDEEFAVRVSEIERLLGEADRLSQMELSIRPAIPDDSGIIRLLAASPRPQPIIPRRSRLEELARSCLPDARGDAV